MRNATPGDGTQGVWHCGCGYCGDEWTAWYNENGYEAHCWGSTRDEAIKRLKNWLARQGVQI